MDSSIPRISNFEKWMITFTVMFVAIIQVLDTTIVNVSLSQMMGSFSSTSEEITWVLTSYLVSSAITMPLTGLLVKRLGCKRLLLINIVGFLIASMLCGIAGSITEIVFFRTLQGIFGASLVPLSQYILRETFPREEQGLAMAVWGIGIMTAPVLGPTIGGYITEALNWRFVFYINAPVCAIAFLLVTIFIKETPRSDTKIDWYGLLLMGIGVGCFQIFLDRGNQVDWFESNTITILIVVSIIALFWFVYRGWSKPDNIVKLQFYKDRHFVVSNLVLAIFCLGMFGIATLQPIMLGTLYNYPPALTGLVMAPRGLASAFAMMLCPLLLKFIPLRSLMIIGLIISAVGAFQMCSFSLGDSMWVQMFPGIIQGLGMGLVFVPVSTTVFEYVAAQDIAEAAGLFSFARSMGTSIGISIMSTVATRMTQVNWDRLAAYVRPDNPYFQQWLLGNNIPIQSSLSLQEILTMQNPLSLPLIAKQVQAQASMLAFIDAYWVATLLFLAIIPLIFLLKKPKYSKAAAVSE